MTVTPRNTRQKAAIRDAFEGAGRPLSTGEALAIAQKSVEGLGIATVYRTVKSLIEEGWLATVELPGETLRYEVAGKAHHHHFQCDLCDRVFELNGCVPEIERLAGPGFAVRTHEVVLYGFCAECARGKKHITNRR
ncbi:MAG TPA: transcriptional repressor [Bryobacteraceae bacterium]|nr:transcriptional repressor [Bryobacteraceae bacterium]